MYTHDLLTLLITNNTISIVHTIKFGKSNCMLYYSGKVSVSCN